jgi:uncharacterized membrane protein
MKYWLFFHLLSIILWAGGALTLSIVLAFHVQEDPETVQPRLSGIELPLFNFIVMPAMFLGLLTGWGMISGAAQQDMQYHWMWVKLGLAMLLFLLTMLLFKRIQDLAMAPKVGKRGRHMVLHWMIGLCVVGILWMVIVRPF